MRDRIQLALDGRLSEAQLAPDEARELQRYRESISAGLACLPDDAAPDVSRAVMQRIGKLELEPLPSWVPAAAARPWRRGRRPRGEPMTGVIPVVPAETLDADLVCRVLAGEREAFSLLVTRHQAALYRHARGLGVDRDTAQDLVQDAFIKAYLRLRQCREPGKFLPWLFRLLRNLTLDRLRDVRRREEPLETPGEAHAFDGGLDRHEARDAVTRTLAGLPGILREAFLLRHQLEASYEEIAEITGVSLSAAKMRVARARDALRRAFGPAVSDDDTSDDAARSS